MKNFLAVAVLCLAFASVFCGPISKTDEIKVVEEKGKLQEETQGVFVKPLGEETKISSTEAPVTTENESAPKSEVSTEKLKVTGRQSSDDDDDDDDDDLGLDVDDDDDDDAADDDDDDDDYFERFFDDLLGEDDDDDDDDVSPSTGSQPVVAAPEPEVPQSNPQEELQSAGEENDGETENPVDGTEIETDNIVEKDPSELDAETDQNSIQGPIVVQPVEADEDDNEADDDDDDDDDDGTDLTDLTGDDDDDDDDDDTADDDDDDDDDDETDLEDVLEAKRSRAIQSDGAAMPSIYISKYNRFVDSIIGRINRILGKSYDPVRVKLHSTSENSKKNKRRKTSTKGKKKNTSKPRVPQKAVNKMGEISVARMTESETREPAFVLVSKTSSSKPAISNETTQQIRASTQNKKKKNSKTKTKAAKKPPKPRATLFGLSSIKREGDVTVNMMSDHTTVKTNFLVGPLTLRVEKEFGRGAKREIKSATATTAQMHGRLNLKIKQGGVATLHSIRVLQPKQVRVDSPDEHEKTKEYMWKRSSHIATVVAQKLASATRSMLKPPPK